MKKGITVLLVLAIAALALFAAPALAEEKEEAFAEWNSEAPALKALIEYVEDVTDETSENYIPPADRIATFDMDGTLCAELYPTYLEYWLLARRIFCDPDYEPDEEMLAFGRILRDCALDKSFPQGFEMDHAVHAAKAYAGMTLNEFDDFVTRQLVRDVDGFEGMTYAASIYLPMIEVVEYLEDNGFKVYVCSGSDRFICRTLLEGMLDIPYEQIIGMDVALEVKDHGDTEGLNYSYTMEDTLVRTDKVLIKNLKTNKVFQIAQEIGRQPVLSFGNSGGDTSMHNYTLTNNKYKSAAFMLIADDEERDYGNTEKARALGEKWEAAGYHVISMKDDFRTIYGDDVKKTGTFNWMAEFAEEPYQLKQVTILSRHNIRSPLSEKGSVVSDITPHEWFAWTSNPGELSLRGAMLETTMGQYFRLYLESQGLFPENYIPEDGAVRFYANGYQRTQATAHYFSTGLLPVSVVPVERKFGYNEPDQTFLPVIRFMNDQYEQEVREEIDERGGGENLSGYRASLEEAWKLIKTVTDIDQSEAYQSGKYGNMDEDETVLSLNEGEEPTIAGPMKYMTSVADALVLQYYEEPDDLKAAFGHELTKEEWKTIGNVLKIYEKILFTSPKLAANLAHPMLEEIYQELTAEGRKFSFLCGHDSTITSFLAALGVEEYELPGAIETSTPIGTKVVFERWVTPEGKDFYKVSLVYQSTEQLRSIQPLSLEIPPMIVPLTFEGVTTNEDGMIAGEDLLNLFLNKIGALEEIEQTYAEEELEDAA